MECMAGKGPADTIVHRPLPMTKKARRDSFARGFETKARRFAGRLFTSAKVREDESGFQPGNDWRGVYCSSQCCASFSASSQPYLISSVQIQ